MAEQCSGWRAANRGHSMPCSRVGVVEYKGAWYCKQHDPAAVEARRKAKETAQVAELEARMVSPVTKDFKDMSLDELVNYWCGKILLGIGRGDYHSEVAECIRITQMNAYDRGVTDERKRQEDTTNE